MRTCLAIAPVKTVYQPLDVIAISGLPSGRIVLMDGACGVYHRAEAAAGVPLSVTVGGAAGSHGVFAESADGGLRPLGAFQVAAATGIQDRSGRFGALLRQLHKTMANSCGSEGQRVMLNGKHYYYFIRWLRDHTHTLKGMKYFDPELRPGLELYTDTQREDGMVYDRICPRQSDAQGWRDYTFKEGGFTKIVWSNPDGTGTPHTVQRIPVENDLEFLFLECLYVTWKATGDTPWMSRHLDAAIKAVRYATSDPYRWSEKFQLLKRGYTIDTWDFMHHDDTRLTLGDNVCDLRKTTFGVMFGDNTGMAASLRMLAEMLRAAGRAGEAPAFERKAEELLARLEALAWNGRFYTHHVSEDPSFRRDVGGTDEAAQVTLSNAYSINRGIGEEKSRAIIRTYQDIRRRMPSASPGEFYNCYPPFEKGFGHANSLWQYMNGGVSTIVAGELARGAFRFGEEAYGADILRRIEALAARHGGHLHVCFNGNPQAEPPPRELRPLPLGAAAGVSFASRGSAGWGDPGNDLSRLPRGRSVFAGIPFEVGEAGVGVSDGRAGYPREAVVRVGGRHAALYLLHTTNGHGVVAEMTVRYADGDSRAVYLQTKSQLDGWFMPESGELSAACHSPRLPNGWPPYQLAWRGPSGRFENVGVFVWGWDNPRPDAEIAEVAFAALKKPGDYLLAALTGSDKPVWFPQSDISFGIPDAWGAAAVIYALVEGLAGVVDTGVAFDRVEISPRWGLAGEEAATVTVAYPASGGYAAYAWERTGAGQALLVTSSAEETVVRLPFEGGAPPAVLVDGAPAEVWIERPGPTAYACVAIGGRGVRRVECR